MRSSTCWFGLYVLLVLCGEQCEARDQLPVDVAADNAYLEEYATNAVLTTEERKIVALLERIENKFSTLGEDEKVEFVKKIANYQDRFATTLSKVETIPGMYGLNVPLLRSNLGIPSTTFSTTSIPSTADEEIEELEVHEDYTIVENEVEISVEDMNPEVAVKTNFQPEVIARKAAVPTRQVHEKFEETLETKTVPEKTVPEKFEETPETKTVTEKFEETPETKTEITMDDLYTLTLQLTNLIMIQMMSNKPQQPAPYHPAVHIPSPPVPSYSPVYNRPRYNVPRNPMPQYNAQQTNNFNGMAYPQLQRPIRNKRKRRSTDKKRKRRNAPADKMTYEEWYNNEYTPYMTKYMAQMADYEAQLTAYNLAQVQAHIPKNPYGTVKNSFNNPYYEYSKKAYGNFLHEQVIGSNPQATYANAYGKWKCELSSTKNSVDATKIVLGQNCWASTTLTCAAHTPGDACDDGSGSGSKKSACDASSDRNSDTPPLIKVDEKCWYSVSQLCIPHVADNDCDEGEIVPQGG